MFIACVLYIYFLCYQMPKHQSWYLFITGCYGIAQITFVLIMWFKILYFNSMAFCGNFVNPSTAYSVYFKLIFDIKTLQGCIKQKLRSKYVHPVERWTSKVYVLAHKHATTSCCLPLQRVFSTLTSRNNAVTFHLVNELWLSLLSSTFKQNDDD